MSAITYFFDYFNTLRLYKNIEFKYIIILIKLSAELNITSIV